MPNNENDNRDIIAVRSNAQKPEEAPERPAAQTENKDASQRPQPKRTARRTVSFGETRTAAGAQEPTRKMDPVDQQAKKTVESAQDTVYPFHIALDSKDGVFILETAENALKGNENV